MHLKRCDFCQGEFETPRLNTNYCSSSCKQSAYRQRQGDDLGGGYDEFDEPEDEQEYDQLGEIEQEDIEQDESEQEDIEQEQPKKKQPPKETKKDQYPVRIVPPKPPKRHEEPEYVEAEEVNSVFTSKPRLGLSDADTRQIQATGIFMQYVVHLRNSHGQTIKSKMLNGLIRCFESLQEQYETLSLKEYSLYPFSDSLETIIAELTSYKNRFVKREMKYVNFDLGEDYTEWFYHLERKLKEYKQELRKRAR